MSFDIKSASTDSFWSTDSTIFYEARESSSEDEEEKSSSPIPNTSLFNRAKQTAGSYANSTLKKCYQAVNYNRATQRFGSVVMRVASSFFIKDLSSESSQKFLSQTHNLPQFTKLLQSISNIIKPRVIEAAKEADFKSIGIFAEDQKTFIEKITEYLVLKIGENLIRNTLEQGDIAVFPDDLFCRMVFYLIDSVNMSLNQVDWKELKEIDELKIDDEEKQNLRFEYLKPVISNLMEIAFPNKEADIPVKGDYVQKKIWDLIEKEFFLPLILKSYHFTIDPKDKPDQLNQENALQLDSFLTITSDFLKSEMPILVQDNALNIAQTATKSFGISGDEEKWVQEKVVFILQKIATSDQISKDKLNFFEGYVKAIFCHAFTNFAKEKQDILIGSFENLVNEFADHFLNKKNEDKSNSEFAKKIISKAKLEDFFSQFYPNANNLLCDFITKAENFVLELKEEFQQNTKHNLTNLKFITKQISENFVEALPSVLAEKGFSLIEDNFQSEQKDFLSNLLKKCLNSNLEMKNQVVDFTTQTMQLILEHILLNLSSSQEGKDPLVGAVEQFFDLLSAFLTENYQELSEKESFFRENISKLSTLLKITEDRVLEKKHEINELSDKNLNDYNLAISQIEQLETIQINLFSKLSSSLLKECGLETVCQKYFPSAEKNLSKSLLSFYREMTFSKTKIPLYEESFKNLLFNGSLDSLKPLEKCEIEFGLNKSINGFRDCCNLIAKDIFTFFKPKDKSEELSDDDSYCLEKLFSEERETLSFLEIFHSLIERDDIRNYLEGRVSDIIFKVAISYADTSKIENLSWEENSLKGYIITNIINHILKIVDRDLKNLDPKSVHQAKLKELTEKSVLSKSEKEQKALLLKINSEDLVDVKTFFSKIESCDQLDYKKALNLVLNELFVPVSKSLLKDACKDPKNELLEMIPAFLRPMLFAMIENEVLPGLVADLYCTTHEWEFKKDKNSKNISKIISQSVKDPNNHFLSLCSVFASKITQQIESYLKNNGKNITQSLVEAIPKSFFDILGGDSEIQKVLEKNIEKISSSSDSDSLKIVLPFLKDYFESVLLQVISVFVLHVKDIEYKDDTESHELFTDILEKLLTAVNNHLKTVYDVSSEDASYLPWKIGNVDMIEGFKKRKKLHPVYFAEKEHFKNLSTRLLEIVGIKKLEDLIAVPKELQQPVYNGLINEILPTTLKSLIDEITHQDTLDLLLHTSLTVQGGLVEEFKKVQFVDILNNVESEVVKISELLKEAENFDVKKEILQKEKNLFISNIDKFQNQIYILDDINEAKDVKKSLLELKILIKYFPTNDNLDHNLQITSIESFLNGGEDKLSMIQVINSAKEKLSAFTISDEDKNSAFNKTCGDLFLNLVNLLPHSYLVQSLLNSNSIKEMTSSMIGKAILNVANKWTVLKLMNQGIEKGVKSVAKGDWFYSNGNRKFIPGKWVELENLDSYESNSLFFKVEEGVYFKFDPSENYEFITNSPEDLKKRVIESIIEKVETSLKNGISSFFSKQFENFNDILDLSVSSVFGGKKGKAFEEARKKMLTDSDSFINKLTSLISKVLDLLFHPLNEVFWYLLRHLYIEPKANELRETLHLNINQNLIYEGIDILFGALMGFPKNPDSQEPALSEKERKLIESDQRLKQSQSNPLFSWINF